MQMEIVYDKLKIIANFMLDFDFPVHFKRWSKYGKTVYKYHILHARACFERVCKK